MKGNGRGKFEPIRGLNLSLFSQSEAYREIDERKSHWLHFRWRNTKLDTTARWGGEWGVSVSRLLIGQSSVLQPSDWLLPTLPDPAP